MRILFMGTAELACPALERLRDSPRDEVVGVVTQPDRPRGRNLRPAPSPVKAHARGRGLEVLTPERVNHEEALRDLRALQPDLIVVIAYGQILRAPLLALPPLGCLNVHASLLPAYRGAAPIQWAIANGERETGVTTMRMNERMDAGDILLQVRVPIGPDATAGALHDILAAAGAALLADTLAALRAGTLAARPQDERLVTYAPKLKKTDGRIDWRLPAAQIRNRVRGFNPWPCCHAEVPAGSGRQVRVLAVGIAPAGAGATSAPGTIVALDAQGPCVACGDGVLRLGEVQPPGGRAMSGAAYARGHKLEVGQRLG